MINESFDHLLFYKTNLSSIVSVKEHLNLTNFSNSSIGIKLCSDIDSDKDTIVETLDPWTTYYCKID